MWVKLDDGFYDHPKIRAIVRDSGFGPVGFLVCLMTWSARYLTDGTIPEQHVRELAGHTNRVTPLVTPLVTHGVLRKVSRKRHGVTTVEYRIHDFTDYNDTAEEVKARRAAATARQRRHRNRQREDTRHAVTNGSDPPVSQHPVPSRPIPPKPPAATRSETEPRRPEPPTLDEIERQRDEAEQRARQLDPDKFDTEGAEAS